MQSNIIHLPINQNDTYQKIEIYRDINQRLKKLTKDEVEVKKQLSEGYFFSHEEFVWDGKLLLTYESRSRNYVDQEKLKKEYPEAFAACQKITEYKQFSLK